MNREETSLIKEFMKEHRPWLGAVAGAVVVFLLMFWLCGLSLTIPLYLACLYLVIQVIVFLIQYKKFCGHHKELCSIQSSLDTIEAVLPKEADPYEKDYQQLLLLLADQKRQMETEQKDKDKEASDYQTLWAHQIKVPIAAMSLLLQTETCDCKEELKGKLFDIEGYVEMMLCYQRLRTLHNDLLIGQCNLENIVQNAVRKYARMFIRKKIKLDFESFSCQVLTDEKWLQFVIEQILSNALKYTKTGSVSIKCDCEKQILTIQDTGMGIAKEDLSRVFERGFTGTNGRNERTSTGLGLYLCNRIVGELSHAIQIDSVIGEGTKVSIIMDNITIL
ncbi:MAG: sensor histidine kinase [Hespellia sp.]|nr:sensor histidine kinase [Hespellia sp.]